MALSEESRSAAYEGLTEVVGEEAAAEMLAHFPAREVEEPVTREFLRAELSDLRVEMSDLRAAMERGFRLQTVSMIGVVTGAIGFFTVLERLT